MRTCLGIFGGTFDPIHLGHLAAAEDAREKLSLDRVLFVPNRKPPHKQGQAVSEVEDRVAMVELSLVDNDRFELSSVELARPGPSYSLDTMRELRRLLPGDTELVFLTGWEALSALHTWHDPQALLDEFRVAVLDRPVENQISWEAVEARFPGIRREVEVVHVVQMGISAKEIRRRVRDGRSIRYHVVPAVRDYILDHRLYQPDGPSRA